MFIYLLFIILGIYLIVLSMKRRKEYRSYGTCLTLGIVLILFPIAISLALLFSMAAA